MQWLHPERFDESIPLLHVFLQWAFRRCVTVVRFEYHGFEMGGTTTVSVFGDEIFSISGNFAFLVWCVMSAVICVATGIAGALASWPIVTRTNGGRE